MKLLDRFVSEANGTDLLGRLGDVALALELVDQLRDILLFDIQEMRHFREGRGFIPCNQDVDDAEAKGLRSGERFGISYYCGAGWLDHFTTLRLFEKHVKTYFRIFWKIVNILLQSKSKGA